MKTEWNVQQLLLNPLGQAKQLLNPTCMPVILKLCREEMENVPKNISSTNVISNFLLFWTCKELIKLS
jgi:hypothetical protein